MVAVALPHPERECVPCSLCEVLCSPWCCCCLSSKKSHLIMQSVNAADMQELQRGIRRANMSLSTIPGARKLGAAIKHNPWLARTGSKSALPGAVVSLFLWGSVDQTKLERLFTVPQLATTVTHELCDIASVFSQLSAIKTNPDCTAGCAQGSGQCPADWYPGAACVPLSPRRRPPASFHLLAPTPWPPVSPRLGAQGPV